MTAELSVVVPSVNGWGDLEGCLEALAGERQAVGLDVVVVDRVGEDLRRRVESRFPWARLVEAAPGTPIPDLRVQGFERTEAPAVAVIEDHVIVPPGWARQMVDAEARDGGASGGAVENRATSRYVDRVAFLCEYSHLLPPLPAGPVVSLPGNNVVYSRAVFERFQAVLREGRWEDRLHEAMRGEGLPLISRPDIRVGHKKHYTIWEYMSQRFLYSRSFAGGRTRNWPAWRRMVYGVAALGLPPLLLWRVLRTAWRKQVDRGELVLAIPLLTLFVVAWGLGEVVGAWLGPGDAMSRVC